LDVTISSSNDNATDDDDKRIQLSLYSKVPHMKKDACDTKMSTSYNKSKQQLMSN